MLFPNIRYQYARYTHASCFLMLYLLSLRAINLIIAYNSIEHKCYPRLPVRACIPRLG